MYDFSVNKRLSTGDDRDGVLLFDDPAGRGKEKASRGRPRPSGAGTVDVAVAGAVVIVEQKLHR